MNQSNNYTYISTAATTLIGAPAATGPRRVKLMGIFINKTTTGTVTIKNSSTTIGAMAIGTTPGTYWLSDGGVEINDLQIVTSAADDLTVSWNNL